MPKARMLLASISILFALVGMARAETAASIDYAFVERPANLSPDFEASGGTSLRFMAIKTIDGFGVDAALWQPTEKAVAKTTLTAYTAPAAISQAAYRVHQSATFRERLWHPHHQHASA